LLPEREKKLHQKIIARKASERRKSNKTEKKPSEKPYYGLGRERGKPTSFRGAKKGGGKGDWLRGDISFL